MYLKKYQQRVISEIKEYLKVAKETKSEFELVLTNPHIPAAQIKLMASSMNYVQTTHDNLKLPYTDICKNGFDKFYPRVNLKIPTGGGKTILAVEAIKEYQTLFAQKKTGLVVWIVPKEIIYKQTVERLRDKGNPYRQLLDQASGGRTIIAEKGHKLSKHDIEENLVILFIMIQSAARKPVLNKSLKIFQDSGGYDSFFPEDNRYDLHYQWWKQVPNLDVMWNSGEQAQLITSLGNAVRVSKPFIIIDEFHKVFTPLSKSTIDGLNPEFILGLTATPIDGMNNLCKVTGLELKNEEMVKLDLHIIPPVGNLENDWKGMLQNVVNKRNQLEKKANEYKVESGQNIRPIALIQCERTGKDQRGNGFVHSEDVKHELIEKGIHSSEIAIKSSDKNDIENIDLFSSDCQIRYIITKYALNEGWDCSFAYVLGIIPNVNVTSNTSVTQLVGRILRQPRAKKTSIKELDESYVYFTQGRTDDLLKNVIKGFEVEGLGDLVSQMQVNNKPEVNAKKTVKIKDEFKKYEYAFYLPLWVTTLDEDNKFRTFKYAFDVKPFLDFESITLPNEVIEKIKNSLSEEHKERNTFSITITDENKIAPLIEEVESNTTSSISITYITGRFGEYIENAFLARKKAVEFIEILKEEIGIENLTNYFSYITAILTQHLEAYKQKKEEQIFKEALENGKIKLAITSEKKTGFRVPESDVITTNSIPNLYNKNLYNDVEVTSINSLEKKVISILEDQETTLFWFRNKVAKNWYAIQGWRENKIRPDFVVAKKKGEGKIEIVYMLESKGEHLLGNNDTTYKNEVFKTITAQNKKNKIETCQIELDFGEDKLNKSIEAYLIEDQQEEQQIKELMK